jgi:hypothetical protein
LKVFFRFSRSHIAATGKVSFGEAQNVGFVKIRQIETLRRGPSDPFQMAERKSETSFQKILFKPFQMAVFFFFFFITLGLELSDTKSRRS